MKNNSKNTVKAKKTLNPFKNKKLKYGGLSVLFTVIFIVAVVLVNIIITMLGDRFSASADLTDAGLYTIEQSSADYLATITDKVKITVTNDESTFTNMGTYFRQTNEVLKKIANCNGNITLDYIDIISNPGFQANYSETISQGNIVVESEGTGRVKVLDQYDYLSVNYNETYLQYGYYQIDSVDANCEQAVVSAIMNVTDTDPVKVAVLTGYGETENQTLKTLLETNSYVVESVNITLTDKISEDYDFVFIFGPDKDYAVADINKLSAWLDNDGKFGKNLIYVSNPKLGDSPNLDGLLDDWGLKIEKGTLYQTDANYAYESQRTYQMFQVPETDFSEFSNDSAVFGENMSAVTTKWEGYGNMTTQVLLSTYDGAVIKPQNAGDNWEPDANAEKKSYGAVVQSYKMRFEGTEPYTSRIVAVGGMELLSSTFLSAAQANNAQFIMNIFNVSCDKEAGITLTPKSYSSSTFEITEAQKNALVIAFVVVLPILLIITGIVVWIRRIHK